MTPNARATAHQRKPIHFFGYKLKVTITEQLLKIWLIIIRKLVAFGLQGQYTCYKRCSHLPFCQAVYLLNTNSIDMKLLLILGLLTVQDSLVTADFCPPCNCGGSQVAYEGEKVLIVTGWNSPLANGRETEVIDLEDSGFVCATTKLQPFPVSTWSGTGGLIGETPMVCGGVLSTKNYEESFSEACYTLQEDGSWKEDEVSTLSIGRVRASAGSVVVNNELVIGNVQL